MFVCLRLPFDRSITVAVGRHPGRAFTDGTHVYSARTLAEAQALAMEGVYLDWREVWDKEWRAVGDAEILPTNAGCVTAAEWTRNSGDLAVLWAAGERL